MDISPFILLGELNGIAIGTNISQIAGLSEILTQEGDIPALYQYDIEGHSFQLTVLDNIVVGLDFDLGYYPDALFTLNSGAHTFQLSFHTGLDAFLGFLEENKIGYMVNTPEYESLNITILQSDTKLYFNDDTKTVFRVHKT